MENQHNSIRRDEWEAFCDVVNWIGFRKLKEENGLRIKVIYIMHLYPIPILKFFTTEVFFKFPSP